jgi:hypothetical protein
MPQPALIVLVVALPVTVTFVLLAFQLRRRRREYADLDAGDIVTDTYRLPVRENWQINRAIHVGRAVGDPALATRAASRAEHVVRLCERGLHRIHRLRWAYRLLPPIWLAGIVLALVGGALDEGLDASEVFRAAWQALTLCLFVAIPAITRRRRRQALAAAEANQALAATHPDAVWTGSRRDPRRVRARRSALLWIVGVAVGTPVAHVFFRLYGTPVGWPLTALFVVLLWTFVVAASWYVVPTTRTDPPGA